MVFPSSSEAISFWRHQKAGYHQPGSSHLLTAKASFIPFSWSPSYMSLGMSPLGWIYGHHGRVASNVAFCGCLLWMDVPFHVAARGSGTAIFLANLLVWVSSYFSGKSHGFLCVLFLLINTKELFLMMHLCSTSKWARRCHPFCLFRLNMFEPSSPHPSLLRSFKLILSDKI